MVLPVKPVVYPAFLNNALNGKIDINRLSKIHSRGWLEPQTARAFKALQAAAAAVGILLTFTFGGTYRTFEEQVTLFLQRYEPVSLAIYMITPAARRKTWNGQTYRLRKAANGNYFAMAAVPGTSNHGLAIAIDLASGTDPSNAVALAEAAHLWLLANVDRFGFSYEVQSERWHVRRVTGDNIEPAILAYEASQGQPTPWVPDPWIPNRPTLSGSDSSRYTLYVQRTLRATYGPGICMDDSFYGPVTMDAVRWFQGNYGLPITGIVDQSVWPVIDNVSNFIGAPK